MTRILVLGGYGIFGRRAVERLARDPTLEIVVAGRSEERARVTAWALGGPEKAALGHAALDATRPDAAVTLAHFAPRVVLNASGPFQRQDYRLVRACIEQGIHYVDIADARAYVTGIRILDGEAKAAGVLVVSGASSVPALASAVLDHLARRFKTVETVEHGISPGNSFDPGLATTASVLGGLGAAFPMLIEGTYRQVHGWQDLTRRDIPEVGPRLFGNCEVPDLDLLPERYASLHTVRFQAGLEVATFHYGLWALSWLRRLRLLPRPDRFAGPLLKLKNRFPRLGSDVGVMTMTVTGMMPEGEAGRATWALLARQGHGPYLPTVPAVMIARALAKGELALRGAMPCVGLMTLEDFTAEVADLAVTQRIT